ncbi:MAG: VCBS repeat-containing protein [Chloroflexi bacterium]|nr:VCBS repeat-containing protein [Chloroflexota bacterium]
MQMPEFIKFTEHLIADGFNYAYGFSVIDLNGDGHLDIVAADTDVGLYWFENDGHCNFTKHIVHLRQGEWIERHEWGDIDGDGQPEFVGIDNKGGAVHYFDITGDPRDAGSWVQHYIDPLGELPGAYDVALGDFDEDGDLDVAVSSVGKGNRFTWYENRRGVWVKHLIEEVAEARDIRAVDINGNGKLDLLCMATVARQVMWYENLSSFGSSSSSGSSDPAHQPWKKHMIDFTPRPMFTHPIDMDGDGDLDILLATGLVGGKREDDNCFYGQIVWYENEGRPNIDFWKKHIIADAFHLGFEALAADLDGDGHLEVVATGWGKYGRIALFKHQGDPRGPWQMQILHENWLNANSLCIVDLDGDGRLDIVAVAERGANELRWWHNEGPVKQ